MEKKTIVILAVVVAIVAVAAAVALIRPATTQTSITDLTLCVELAENQSCIMPQTDFRPDVLIFYVFEYEDLSSSDNLEERWYLGEKIWTESFLYTDHNNKTRRTQRTFRQFGHHAKRRLDHRRSEHGLDWSR